MPKAVPGQYVEMKRREADTDEGQCGGSDEEEEVMERETLGECVD